MRPPEEHPTRTPLYVPAPRTLLIGQRVHGLAISSDGTRLATASPARIRVWDLRTGSQVWEQQIGHRMTMTEVYSVAFSPDGSRLATGSEDNTVRIWDATTGDQQLQLTHTSSVAANLLLKGRLPPVFAVAFSPDGSRLATGSEDNTVRIWDATTGDQQLQLTHTSSVAANLLLKGRLPSVLAVAFSPDGSRLATGNRDFTARIWDTTTGHQQLQLTHPAEVYSVAVSPDGGRLATAAWWQVGVWDLRTDAQVWKQRTGWIKATLKGTHMYSVAFSPDGHRLATGGGDNTARIWDATTGQQQLQLTHQGTVYSVAFSPDGSRLVTGSADQTARIWDVTTGYVGEPSAVRDDQC